MVKFVRSLVILFLVLSFLPLDAKKVSVLEELNKPEAIQFGSGNMYILEGTTVFIYDEAALKYKGQFGKQGEGPGEIKKNPFGGPLIMTPHRDKVTISSTGKYSIFSKDGKFEKEIKISPFESFYPFEDLFVCFSIYSEEPGKPYLAVYMADKNLKKVEKPLVISDTLVGPNFKFLLPFTSFAPFPYKDKLYIVPEPMVFAIQVYDKNGKKIDSIKKEYKRKKIPAEYRNKTEQWFKNDPAWKNLYEAFKSRITFRDDYPPIMAHLVDSDKIYVFTYNFDKKGDRECIIMDLKGKELKRVYLPIKENYGMDFTFPYNIHNNHFYILMEDIEEEIWELHKIKL